MEVNRKDEKLTLCGSETKNMQNRKELKDTTMKRKKTPTR